jgi:hypothetical protein
MKRIILTKYRSSKQMEKMAFNLRETLKCYCSVDYNISHNAHTNTYYKPVEVKEKYNIYVSKNPTPHTYYESWEDLLQGYISLMNKKD